MDVSEFFRLIFAHDLLALIKTVGYGGLFGIVFAETGLFLGFFLPGDSLLFVAGFLAGEGFFSIYLLWLLLFVAAVAGNMLGYEFGRHVGQRLYSREDSVVFKKAHLYKTQAFYAKHGSKTIVLARFMPIVRTFAPIIAGIANMKYSVFLFWNILGAILWTTSLLWLGYWLGNVIDVDKYLLPIILIIVIVSFLPGAHAYFRERRKTKQDMPPSPDSGPAL